MKILIVGNDPHDIGGVANYTQPLAGKFVELGHEVSYFYSGAWNRKYNWLFKPYIRIDRNSFLFECAELINSPCWTNNYGYPSLDIAESKTERAFAEYIDRVKPEVMHVNSRLGLPASILEIASKKGITVFNTIHVYGMLCQNRVMIDSDGLRCDGPMNLDKCFHCTRPLDIGKLKLTSRIGNTNREVLELLLTIKRYLVKSSSETKHLEHDKRDYKGSKRNLVMQGLLERLKYMIHIMNNCVAKNICVSSGVRDIIRKYGVGENKLIVSHIGSRIAEKQKLRGHKLHEPVVVGNIGGVGYYKGQHVLVEAIERLEDRRVVVKIFGKYDEEYVRKIMKGREKLPVEFLGRYKPEDLTEILEQIDVMVCPSIFHDPAPQTIFESYSGGIPIIASRIGGFTDFIQDGVNGYLFEPGDSNDLADKLRRCLDSPKLLEEFSNKIPRLKSITENAFELLNLYRETI